MPIIRHNLRDIIQAMSIQNQTTLTVLDNGNLFRQFEAESIAPAVPTRTKIEDNRVGTGNANPKKGKPYYFDPRNLSYPTPLRSRFSDRMLRLLCGGSIVTTTNAGTPNTYDHLISEIANGSEPLQVNLLRQLGGEKFLHAGVYCQQIEYSQEGAEEPRMSVGLGSTGHFAKISETSIDVNDIEAVTEHPFDDFDYHGAKTQFSFSDGVTTFDFGTNKRLLSLRVTLTRTIVIKNAPGDSPRDANNECQGFYAGTFYTDVGSAEITAKIAMDDDFEEFNSWLPDKSLTNILVNFRSCKEIESNLGHRQEHGIKIPEGEYNLVGDPDANDSAFTMTIKAIEGDSVTGDLYQGIIRTLDADLDTEV